MGIGLPFGLHISCPLNDCADGGSVEVVVLALRTGSGFVQISADYQQLESYFVQNYVKYWDQAYCPLKMA